MNKREPKHEVGEKDPLAWKRGGSTKRRVKERETAIDALRNKRVRGTQRNKNDECQAKRVAMTRDRVKENDLNCPGLKTTECPKSGKKSGECVLPRGVGGGKKTLIRVYDKSPGESAYNRKRSQKVRGEKRGKSPHLWINQRRWGEKKRRDL